VVLSNRLLKHGYIEIALVTVRYILSCHKAIKLYYENSVSFEFVVYIYKIATRQTIGVFLVTEAYLLATNGSYFAIKQNLEV